MFNKDLVRNDIVVENVIFGKNSSGKTNLCYAIFDLFNQLTYKVKTTVAVLPYLNLEHETKYTDFSYEFLFDMSKLKYECRKLGPEEIVYEKLVIDDNLVVEYDYERMEGISKLSGSENLNMNIESNKLSFVKYINSNTVLEKNDVNDAFKAFIDFVNNMLLFSSLSDGNKYFGFTNNSESITESIVKNGKLKDFELFLKQLGLNYELDLNELDGKNDIVVKFP